MCACVQDGNHGKVTGWGLTRFLGKSSRFLRKVTLPVVGYKDCTASTEQVCSQCFACLTSLHEVFPGCDVTSPSCR